MTFFGWTISNQLLLGDPGWLEALDMNSYITGEFEPTRVFWKELLSRILRIVRDAGLDEHGFGCCLHFSAAVAPFMRNVGLIEYYMKAQEEFTQVVPCELGIHAQHQPRDLVTSPRFPAVFTDDIKLASMLNAVYLVEHPPVGTRDTIEETIDVIASPWFCTILHDHPGVTIAWENKADYAKNRRFFGSLDRMVEFRACLVERLHEIGEGGLAPRHQFCFDTGHLLIWRETAGATRAVDKEISEILPSFARNVVVFHFQANDGIVDAHVTPFSSAFLDHGSRSRMDIGKFKASFNVLRNWIRTCLKAPHPPGQHFHLEAGTLPFSLEQYGEFARELENLLIE